LESVSYSGVGGKKKAAPGGGFKYSIGSLQSRLLSNHFKTKVNRHRAVQANFGRILAGCFYGAANDGDEFLVDSVAQFAQLFRHVVVRHSAKQFAAFARR
jgi:hypothetical protein